MFKLIQGLIAPNTPNEDTFAELVDLSKNHYNSNPLKIVQHFKFHSHFYLWGDSIGTFVARQLTENYEFSTTLDMLRDCLICSIKDGCIMHHLLAGQTLTLGRHLILCRQWNPPMKMHKTSETSLYQCTRGEQR